MNQTRIKQILEKYRVIAVVGLSGNIEKASYQVSAYMKSKGYRIIPINPAADEVLGEKSYRSLLEIPQEIQKTVEIVNVFRPSTDVPPIVDQVLLLKAAYGKPYVVWMQLGIINEEAARTAEKAGLVVIMDKCIMVEHRQLQGLE